MNDITEGIRNEICREINKDPQTLEEIREKFGEAWDTESLQRDFDVAAFAAPLVVVRRKSDRQMGTLFFQHSPRVYFSFKEDPK